MNEKPDIHAGERARHPFKTWKDETPDQRLEVHRRRAVQAVIEHPEWDDDKLADEWGISAALVAEARSMRPTHGGTYAKKPSPLSRAIAFFKRPNTNPEKGDR